MPLLFSILLFAAPAVRSADTSAVLRQEFDGTTSRSRKAELARQLADWYRQQGRFDDAVAVSQAALQLEPSKKLSYPLLLAQGDAHLALRRYAQAIESYRDAIALFPKRTEAHFRLAATYEQSELAELARQEYAEILKHDPSSSAAHARMAVLYTAQGLTTRALEHFRAALTSSATPDLCRQMSVCAATSGDSELAVVMLRRVGEENMCYDDYRMLGRLYELLHKDADAERSYRAAMSVASDRIEGSLSLALLYLNSNRLEEARQLLQRLLAQSPDAGAAHFVLAAVYQHQGRASDARREAQAARECGKSALFKDYADRYQRFLSDGGAR